MSCHRCGRPSDGWWCSRWWCAACAVWAAERMANDAAFGTVIASAPGWPEGHYLLECSRCRATWPGRPLARCRHCDGYASGADSTVTKIAKAAWAKVLPEIKRAEREREERRKREDRGTTHDLVRQQDGDNTLVVEAAPTHHVAGAAAVAA
jgi:hypothetical protein